MKISIVCPVLDHPEFIPGFKDAVAGADEVIIVDTGSTEENKAAWANIATRLISYAPRGHNYGHWCNAGYAQTTGDVVVFLNNDVKPVDDWIEAVRVDVLPGAIYGPELLAQIIGGVRIPFLSGWCIATAKATWDRLNRHADTSVALGHIWDGPWNTDDYPAAGYWEDNDLCFRAIQAGIALQQTTWPIVHLDNGNGTSKHNKAYYADVARNKATFERSVKEAMRHATV